MTWAETQPGGTRGTHVMKKHTSEALTYHELAHFFFLRQRSGVAIRRLGGFPARSTSLPSVDGRHRFH